jgi:hypothetical protein
MMMTINQRAYFLFCISLFIIAAVDLQGQARDFQSWWELELNKEVSDKLDLSGEIEQRFKNNSMQYSRTLATLGASYNVLDYLSVAGGVRTIFTMDREQQMHARYRLHLDATGSYDLSGFNLSLRTRLQYGFKEFSEFRYFSLNTLVNRNRLKVAHHIYGTKFDWFALLESFHGSNNESPWLTYAVRYSAGARYALNFRSRFSLRYILEDERNVANPLQLHAVVMGYAYRF